MLIDRDIVFAALLNKSRMQFDDGLREVVRGQKHLSLKTVGLGGHGVVCVRPSKHRMNF